MILMNLSFQSDLPTEVEKLDVIAPANISRIQVITSVGDDMRDISLSPDGKLMAFVTQHQDYDYDIRIFDVQTDTEISSMQGRMDSFRELIWSPDSKHIAVISGRTTGAGVQERSVKTYTIAIGSQPNFYGMGNSDTWYADYIYPKDTPGNPVQVAWSSQSDMVAIAFYEKLSVVDANIDAELFTAPIPRIYDVSWSPDGKRIITRSGYHTVQLWGVPHPEP